MSSKLVNWLNALSICDAYYKSNSIVSFTIITLATNNIILQRRSIIKTV